MSLATAEGGIVWRAMYLGQLHASGLIQVTAKMTGKVGRQTMSPDKRRQRAKGRRTFDPALILRKDIIQSPEWATLTAFEVKLIVDLGAQYKGGNNGDLCAAWSVMRPRGWRSPGTLNKALKSLIRNGWIDLTRQGGKHSASLYALTIWGINECGGKIDVPANPVPSHRWRKIKVASHLMYQTGHPAMQSATATGQKAA